MNTQISKHQRYKSIIRTMDNHPEALEGKTEILTAKELFVCKDNRIEELISELVPPISIVYSPKRETLQLLRVKAKRMTGFGILIAQKHNDLTLLETMKAYRRLAGRNTAYKLYENGLQISAALQQYSEDAVGFGFTLDEIEQFNVAVNSFGELLTDTGYLLNDRKASRTELASLFKDCNKILKENFDPFALFVSVIYPEFFREYSLLRTGSSRKKTVKDTADVSGEISGTITDSNTGLPLKGVTVSIPDYDLVTVTDLDGFYLYDELVAGTYRITCSKQAYQVPFEQIVEITAEIATFDVDFSLIALEASNDA